LIAERLATRPTADWTAALEDAEVPCGAVADLLDAFGSPEATALGMTAEVEHPALGVIRQAGIPLRFERTPGAIRTAPPLLGEHTDEVLGELGYDAPQIARLRGTAVV
jgi:crotonobetainyl-CoA:carnitine CoA-transferase CaiB-like acyl-CoA transferase